MISVIIPLYNKSSHILNTLDSLKKQIYKDFEVIIIDDGSTDDSLRIVSEYCGLDHLKVYTQINKGVSYTRNKGAEYATRKYLFFLDADDILSKDCLSSFKSLIDNNGFVDVFVSNFYLKSSDNIYEFCKLKHDGFIDNPYRDFYSYDVFFRLGNVLIDRGIFLEYKFNESISIYEDFEFFIRLIGSVKVFYTEKILFTYEVDNSELSVKNVKIENDVLNYVEIDFSNVYKTLISYDLVYASLIKRVRSFDFYGVLYFLKKLNIKIILCPPFKIVSMIMKRRKYRRC